MVVSPRPVRTTPKWFEAHIFTFNIRHNAHIHMCVLQTQNEEVQEALRIIDRVHHLKAHGKNLFDANQCEQAVPVLSEAIEVWTRT